MEVASALVSVLVSASVLIAAAMLLYAGWVKLRDRREAADGIEDYQLIPSAFTPAAAALLGAAEVTLGVGVMSGIPLALMLAATQKVPTGEAPDARIVGPRTSGSD